MTERLTVAATGDVMVNRAIASYNESRAPWDLMARADIVFANLETPLTDRGVRADKYITMRADPSVTSELNRMGVDVASVANNHALDYGWEGLADTLDVLSAAGIRTVGGGDNVVSAFEPVSMAVNGLKAAFIGVSCTLPVGFAAGEDRPGIAPIRVLQTVSVDSTVDEQPGTSPFVYTEAVEGDVELACAVISRAKDTHDVVLVAIHWGVPPGWAAAFQGPLATYQRPLGRRLVQAGASALIGHHAHCLLGMELVETRPVLYSLGNLLFHNWNDVSGGTNMKKPMALERPGPPYDLSAMRSDVNYETVIAELTVSADGVEKIEFIPLLLDGGGEPAPVDTARGRAILERFGAMSAALGTRVEVEDGRAVVCCR